MIDLEWTEDEADSEEKIEAASPIKHRNSVQK